MRSTIPYYDDQIDPYYGEQTIHTDEEIRLIASAYFEIKSKLNLTILYRGTTYTWYRTVTQNHVRLQGLQKMADDDSLDLNADILAIPNHTTDPTHWAFYSHKR